MNGPRCWRCRRFLELVADRVGVLVEDCPRCRSEIDSLARTVERLRTKWQKANRAYYARHRDWNRERVARWQRENPDKVKINKKRYRERIKLGLHKPKQRGA